MRIAHAHTPHYNLRMPPAPGRKRPLNISIRADLVDAARASGTNISAVVERALESELREQRREKWRAENRKAIEAWNRWIEENGIPFEDLRPW
jgi:antitoxin CcdA